jgi:hypothetical protein
VAFSHFRELDMAQRMKKLNLGELSGVPKGANQGAFMVLAKAHADTTGNAITRFIEKIAAAIKGKGDAGLTPVEIEALSKEAESFNDVRDDQQNCQAMWELQSALGTSIQTIIDDDTLAATAKRAAIQETIAQFNTAVGNLPALQDAATADDGGVTKGDNDMKPEEVEAMIVAKLAPVSAELATTKAANESLQATVTAQATELATLKSASNESAMVTKARELIGTGPGDVTKIAALLTKLGGDDEAIATVKEMLAQNAELAKSAFATIGQSGRQLLKSDADKVEARAEEIRKAKPALTPEQAYVAALDENPDAYANAEAEG